MDTLQQNINLLGANSYPAILHESIMRLQDVEPKTLVGADLLKEVLSKASSSLAPMLAISEFVTNAEQISKDDASISDVIAFMKKQFKGGDLNFLINLAKEEHFVNLAKNGFPTPAETIKAFKGSFDKHSNEIQKLVQEGVFDSLESNIYNEIRVAYPAKDSRNKLVSKPIMTGYDGLRDLNESVLYNKNGVMQYSPIGMQYEDIENERILLLTESEILSYDEVTKTLKKVTEPVKLPDGHIRVMTAVSNLVYDYEKELFKPSERWDFKLGIDKNGNAILSNPKEGYEADTRIINKNDLRALLAESIAYYDGLLVKPTHYNKDAYNRDADNLIMLAENHDQIIKLDTLLVLKNQNQNYVMLNADLQQVPQLLAGSDIYNTELFESYGDLKIAIEKKLQSNLDGVFENQIEAEQLFTQNRIKNIALLEEEGAEIENMLNDVLAHKKIAQEGSKKFEMLLESEKDLTARLEENVLTQTSYVANNKMYKAL